ncbi:hypothetical protein GMST_33400 [Geomonas silvestris]|uniref:Uncharacterized protein n=2 Tax=Geomonas silvestris TaxID=2740184 RepID=A0A6V8MLU5_9BACT|nr:hypothetical protein GMST_33400 [Geomonas silvestris]
MGIIEKFLNIVSDSTIHSDMVTELFHQIYLRLDLINLNQTQQWATALLAGSDNGEPYRTILDVRMYPERLAACVDACRGQLPNFFRRIGDLIIDEDFKGDEINILLLLNNYLAKTSKRKDFPILPPPP